MHSQCFDEVIRQITINCSERGYLLVSVRDEFKMIKEGLKQLYDSSIAYGMKKALKADQEKTKMRETKKALEKENKELKRQIDEMEEQCKLLV